MLLIKHTFSKLELNNESCGLAVSRGTQKRARHHFAAAAQRGACCRRLGAQARTLQLSAGLAPQWACHQ